MVMRGVVAAALGALAGAGAAAGVALDAGAGAPSGVPATSAKFTPAVQTSHWRREGVSVDNAFGPLLHQLE